MAVDMNEVMEGLEEWLENPYWAQYYNKAPSERCKRYIALDFHYSDTESEEVANEADDLLERLGRQDVEYLLKNARGPEKKKFMEALKKAN